MQKNSELLAADGLASPKKIHPVTHRGVNELEELASFCCSQRNETSY